MTPAVLNFELTRLQLARREGIGPSPLMWIAFAPCDRKGRAFTCIVQFERGPDAHIAFELDGPVDLSGDWEERLSDAIFNCQRWMQ